MAILFLKETMEITSLLLLVNGGRNKYFSTTVIVVETTISSHFITFWFISWPQTREVTVLRVNNYAL